MAPTVSAELQGACRGGLLSYLVRFLHRTERPGGAQWLPEGSKTFAATSPQHPRQGLSIYTHFALWLRLH
jgi:hypothetical protein